MEKVEFTQGILAIQPDLHRFAYKLTADRESANDLVQDCLLQALDNQEKFTYSKNLKGWMYTCLLYTSPSPRDGLLSRMPSSA